MRALAKFCDSFVNAVSPSRGNRRLAARVLRERYEAKREAIRNQARRDPSEEDQRFSAGGFRSSDPSDDAVSWMKSGYSITSALEEDRPEMLERVDSSVKNYELAWNHVEGRVVRVAGTGMTVDPEIGLDEDDGIEESVAEPWNNTLRKNWERTCERIGRNGEELWEIQQQLQRDWERRGEWFVLIGDAADPLAPTTLKVEVIDPDRVSTPDNMAADKRVRMGIRLKDGVAVGCYIRTNQPGDTIDVDRKWQYEPFYNRNGMPRVLHHFARVFRGQHRGFPAMQVATKRLKNAEEYDEAELDGNYVRACHVGVIHTDLDVDDATAGHGAVEDSSGRRVREMSPGQFLYAGMADDVKFNDPGGPSTSFAPYMEYEGRMFAAGCNTHYELLSGNWGELSYTTARLLFNVEDATVAVLQLGQEKTLKWIYRHFVTRSILTGIVDIDVIAYRSNPWPYWAARVIYPPSAAVDPPREDRNEMVNIEGGMKPGGEMVERINGKPARVVYAAVARDRKLRKKYGLEEHLPQMGRDQELQPETDRVPTQIGDKNQESADANSDRQATGAGA